jgi:hypothetical protein
MDNSPLGEFEIIWVRRVFMRTDDEHVVYYTLGDTALLSDPVEVDIAFPHMSGRRPYRMGICVVESHRTMPSGVADLSAPLQQEANEIANERRDNVKLVLNKKYHVARGRQVDVEALVKNAPGAVVMMNNPQPGMDVAEVSWPDITPSAFMEQDRINVDLDELVGNFSQSSISSNRSLNETVGGMRMLGQGASLMTEYLLRTFIETWAEPVMSDLLLLEQTYETDEVILALAGKKAQVWQKFGISRITDAMLEQQLTLSINVGMGATNPDERLRKLLMATTSAIQVVNTSPPGVNVQEIVKDIYAFAGFRDGSRFFPDKADPRLVKAMEMVQQLQGQLQSKQGEIVANSKIEMEKIASVERQSYAELRMDDKRISGDLIIRQAELEVENAKLDLERMKLVSEVQGNNAEQQARIGQAEVKLQQLAEKLLMERERFKLELQRRTEEKGESKGGGQVIVDTTGASVGGFKEMVGMIGTALSEHGNAINGMVQASGKRDELAAAVAELAAKHDELNKRLGAKRVHELV